MYGVQAPKRPVLSSGDHARWRELIAERCGLEFGESRGSYLSRSLWERMQTRGMASYEEYLGFVTGSEGRREWSALLELLVNRETSFFRHVPSYDGLRKVLDEVLKKKARLGNRTLTLWSAGCSTGQEPYSMAMCALDRTAAAGGEWQVRVLGSDISETSRRRARSGKYTEKQAKAIPEPFRRRYLKVARDGSGMSYEVNDRLRSVVSIESWNLVDSSSYFAVAQDIIFCQNLLVYLKAPRRAAIVERLCRRLNPGGHLFLAPGEMVGLNLPWVRSIYVENCLVYQRRSDGTH